MDDAPRLRVVRNSVADGWPMRVDDYLNGSGQIAEQALRRLSDLLRERRSLVTG
jgi:hypothetical protein